MMSEPEGKMSENYNERQNAVRKYLLGNLDDQAEMRRIEEKILLDDDFAEQISLAEAELIDEYLDGALSDADGERFLRFFLVSPENKEKLKLIRNLRKYAAQQAAAPTAVRLSENQVAGFDWRRFFSLPPVRLAALALLLIGFGFGVWRAGFYQSDVDKGLAQLRAAYRGQRPLESRTTADFEYAPVTALRAANETPASDEKARRRAERLLADAGENPSDIDAMHALGLFYLAEKKFDQAAEALNAAIKLDPNNAKIHNDLGALFLEQAKLAEAGGTGGKYLENVNAALRHFDRALELNGNLLEALFNRALVLQKTATLNHQALEAWAKYLEKDATSAWADEARRQMQKLESSKTPNLSANEIEQAFLAAFRQKNDAEAFALISRNRELIKGKYLPQKLVLSYIKAPENEKAEYLQALAYAAALEKKNANDPFADDLRSFYAGVSSAQLELLEQAQISVQNSYQLCLDGKFDASMQEANRARRIFLQTGNPAEAKLAEFLIVYCLIKNDAIGKSIPLAEEIADFCRQKNYKWLLANTLYWLAGAKRSSGDRAGASIDYQNCLAAAEEIGDPQVMQKILVSLARQNKFVGQNEAALDYLQKAWRRTEGISLREKWRTHSDSIEILSAIELYALAQAVSIENIRLAKDLNDASFVAVSQLDAGILYALSGDFAAARTMLNEAKKNGEISLEGADRTELLAKSLLTLSYLERKLDNHSQSAALNDEALSVVENAEIPFFLYEIQKSRLLTDIALNAAADLKNQITKVIDLAETYRRQISEERSRSSFFNQQQDVYDIAVAHEFNHGRYAEAYDYLETSNARSLLVWLKKGVSANYEKEKIKNIEISFDESAAPLPLDAIRRQMPERAQILQYAVLESKTLIWLVSKEKFFVAASPIGADQLNEKVKAYVRAVSDKDSRRQAEAMRLGGELYNFLIAPVVNQLDPNLDICLIPHKILFHLPFAALNAPDEKPFLARFNFFYAPSANVFLLCTANAQRKMSAAPETLLSIGNPSFDRRAFKNLPNLPEAEAEARDIAPLYAKANKLIGAEATESAVRNALRDAAVVNFAGHYIVRHGEPLASGLLVSGSENAPDDNVLTNAELISQKLPQAKLVVLSACQTGVEQYYNGEGLVGLSRTFLAAGVPVVVASQWQVDSAATAELIKRFHFFRKRENLSTAAALRRAQLEMTESADARFRQPFYWAAFAVYGGYAEF